MHRSGFRFGSGLLRRGRHDRRRSRLSTRGAGSAPWRLAGEALEPRALLAVTAVNASGVLQITLGAADDAATLTNDGTNYVVQGTGLPGSFLSANTSVNSVSVVGSAGTNQRFIVSAPPGVGIIVTDPLTVDASVENTFIRGAVNVSGFLQRVSIGSAAIRLAADVSTTGSQRYGGAVTLVGQRTLFAGGLGGITFDSTVDSLSTVVSSLATRTGLGTTFKNSVGGQVPLASLVTSPITGFAGTTSFGSPSVAGMWVRTNGTAGQAFNGPVVLAGNTDFRAGVGPITFAGTVDGTYGLKAYSLNAYSQAATTFGGAVGGTTALASLMTNPNGTTVINGGAITTTGTAGQVFNDGVTLGASTAFKAGIGPVTFASTVDAASRPAPPPPSAVQANWDSMNKVVNLTWTAPRYGVTLTTDTSGRTTFSGAVGGKNPLVAVATNPLGTRVATATITTAPITDYFIKFSDDNGRTWTLFPDEVSVATFATVPMDNDRFLFQNRSYYFVVAAWNLMEEKWYSEASNSVTLTS